MGKIITLTFMSFCILFAEIKTPEVLLNNDFETYEYQLFITNTKK